MTKLFNKNGENQAKSIISDLLKEIKIVDEKNQSIPITLKNIINVKKLKALSDNFIVQDYLIRKTLFTMKKDKKEEIEDFENIYNSKFIDQQKSEFKWLFYIPLIIKFKKRKIKLLKKEFHVISKKRFITEVGKKYVNPLPDYEPIYGRVLSNAKAYLKVEGKGLSFEQAWIGDVSNSFDLLKAIIEFHLYFNDYNYTICIPPKPRSFILGPEIFFGKLQNKIEPLFPTNTLPNPITNLALKNFRDKFSKKESIIIRTIKRFEVDPKKVSLLYLIKSSMLLYSKALNSIFKESTFIHFWQILECVGKAGGKIKAKDEIWLKNIEWYLKSSDFYDESFKKLLELLCYNRNNIVHYGSQTIVDEDINILKIICDVILLKLFRYLKHIRKNDELKEIYSIINKNDKNLKNISKALNFLKRNVPKKII